MQPYHTDGNPIPPFCIIKKFHTVIESRTRIVVPATFYVYIYWKGRQKQDHYQRFQWGERDRACPHAPKFVLPTPSIGTQRPQPRYIKVHWYCILWSESRAWSTKVHVDRRLSPGRIGMLVLCNRTRMKTMCSAICQSISNWYRVHTYSQIELEMQVVDFACKKIHLYLYGIPFSHSPL